MSDDSGFDADIDADLDAELGFGPAVSVSGAAPARPRVRRRGRRGAGVRRKVGAFVVLLGALGAMGGAYAAFAASSGATSSSSDTASISAGHQLFEVACITCHGDNLQGVKNEGPSLIGVGGAAVNFQVSTGRMPLAQQGAEAERKTSKYTEKQIEQIAAYVQSIAGGPMLPAGSLRGPNSSIAEGGELFRVNCASCHGTTFKGAPLSAGKSAPSLNAATDAQIFAAMLTGPESMPVFNNNQLTVSEKKAIIAYVQTIKASNDPGGSGIDRIGPVSEAIVLWTAGVGLLMAAILWIGARSQ